MQSSPTNYAKPLIGPQVLPSAGGLSPTQRLEPVMSLASEHITLLSGDIVMSPVSS